jgi:hemerythrin-like domain-containing protein
MKATQILSEEHRVIERVITSLEKAAAQMHAGAPVEPEFFIDAASFIKGFADGCHHKKEEGVLFKALVDHGMSERGGPVGMMLAEHEQGRVYTRAMLAAAQELQNGDATARARITQNAQGYAALLRQHILKEDTILFPMADQLIPLDQQDDVYVGFERVEHEETGEGVHEKYLGLAERLEGQVV